MKHTFYYMLLLIFISACGTGKEEQQVNFPATVAAQKTAAHKRVAGTKFFVLVPAGFKEKDEYSGAEFTSATGEREGFGVSQTVVGADYPTTVEGMRAQLEKRGEEVLELRSITYNGMPAIYYQTLFVRKFYHSYINIPMPDKSTVIINGFYTKETSPENRQVIFNAMQQAYFDENYQVDHTAERMELLSITGNASGFKLAMVDTSKTNFTYYYTPNGKSVDDKLPYLLLFEANKTPVSGRVGDDNYRMDLSSFPTYAGLLGKDGYDVQRKGYPKEFTLNYKKARETLLEGIDKLSRKPVSLLLTEVNNQYSVVVMLGVADKGDEKSIAAFKLMGPALVIK